MKESVYLCIDLKSYYASVECIERGLDPTTVRLVVADPERTEKTICLAVSPALKALGIPGRCRVFELPKGIDYILATPRMWLYMRYSAQIYTIYLRYVSQEDIHVYSVDEAFLDITAYYSVRGVTPREFAAQLLRDIRSEVGITATCGIGSNLYLAKIALDICSKKDSSHIGVLTESAYCQQLWDHEPITDFWRVGPGTARRLAEMGIRTMRGVTGADKDMMYRTFGIDAELLIDHAWGRESTTMADIKSFTPVSRSLNRGQVLTRDYGFDEGRIIVREMAEDLALELFEKGLQAESVGLSLGYAYHSPIPPTNGSLHLDEASDSVDQLVEQAASLYDSLMVPEQPIRRLTLSYGGVHPCFDAQKSIFTQPPEQGRERSLQNTIVKIKNKYGKNGVFKGIDLLDGATALERNRQIGGHRA